MASKDMTRVLFCVVANISEELAISVFVAISVETEIWFQILVPV
jgi:hypothetical protein